MKKNAGRDDKIVPVNEKAEIELYLQKIRQKIESGPEWSKKAAMILSKMVGKEKGSQ